MKNNNLDPPLSNLVLYWFSILSVPFLFLLEGYYFLLVPFLMIIIHHGTHEAAHNTLVSKRRFGKLFAFISGVSGFAILGHNFIFLRWSHMSHHRHGRSKIEYTIDGMAKKLKNGKVYYYLSLFGASYIYHEIAGYLYPIVGDKYHFLSRRFKKKYYRNKSYYLCQLMVFGFTVGLFWLGGLKFLFCKCCFMLYWGAFQNVAHHNLDIGDYEHSNIASRTYKLPSLIEFLIFRSGPYHLEHHAFPWVPGPKLNSPIVKERIIDKLGSYPNKHGWKQYIYDTLIQYKGISSSNKTSKVWKKEN